MPNTLDDANYHLGGAVAIRFCPRNLTVEEAWVLYHEEYPFLPNMRLLPGWIIFGSVHCDLDIHTFLCFYCITGVWVVSLQRVGITITKVYLAIIIGYCGNPEIGHALIMLYLEILAMLFSMRAIGLSIGLICQRK
jgi:hypothetical protein